MPTESEKVAIESEVVMVRVRNVAQHRKPRKMWRSIETGCSATDYVSRQNRGHLVQTNRLFQLTNQIHGSNFIFVRVRNVVQDRNRNGTGISNVILSVIN